MPKSDFLKEIDGNLSVIGNTATAIASASFDSAQADVWLATKTTDNLTEGTSNLYDTLITFSATIPTSTKAGLMWIQI